MQFPYPIVKMIEFGDVVYAIEPIDVKEDGKMSLPIVDMTQKELQAHRTYSLPKMWSKNRIDLVDTFTQQDGRYVLFRAQMRFSCTPAMAVDFRDPVMRKKYTKTTGDDPDWMAYKIPCSHFHTLRPEYDKSYPVTWPRPSGIVVETGRVHLFHPEICIRVDAVDILQRDPERIRVLKDANWLKRHVEIQLRKKGQWKIA